jgi:hypothetical protein
MNKKFPSFEEWVSITDKERDEIQSSWKIPDGDGREIANKVVEKFKKDYGNIPHLKMNVFLGSPDSIAWFIIVNHPFIFDHKKIPKKYLGFEIQGSTLLDDLPVEFQVKDTTQEYIWAPWRFEKFVDRCIDSIRQELGNHNMSRDEILDALCFGDFQAHVSRCKKIGKTR